MDSNLNNNKRIIPLVIGIITVAMLIIGATYAYFAVGTTNNFGTTTINATAENVGTVTLSNTNSTLSMDLTAADMMRKTAWCLYTPTRFCIAYYDTAEECSENIGETNYRCVGSDINVYYYATPTGKSKNDNDSIIEIARATVSPITDTNYYSCDYTLSISHTGTNDMYTKFNTNYTNKSQNQIQFYACNTQYDWNNDFPSTCSESMIVSAGHPASIYAGMVFKNLESINQTHLAGTDISITIQATSFSCTALEIERLYYNGTNYEDPLDAPGSMPYYVKLVVSEGDVLDAEICAVINSTTVCMPYNAGENYQAYLTQLTNAGATCTDNNKGAYVCTYGLIEIVMDYESSDFVDIYYNDGEHGCSIHEDSEECTNEEVPDSEPKEITDPNSR